MKRYIAIILFIHFSAKAGMAQVFDENSFTRYTVKDGLCQNNVTCLQQDEWGYLWAGTDNGLSRFDGHSFNNYSTSSPALPLLSVKLARLKTFGQHQLGILSHSGLQVLNTSNFSSKNYLVADSTPFITYRNVAWDAQQLPGQGFALTTAAGFYVFDSTGKLSFRHDAYNLSDVGNKRILYGRDIFSLSDGEYLVYTEEDKLAIYNSTKNEFNEVNYPQEIWRGFYSPASPGNQLLGSKYALNNHEFIFINNRIDSIVYYNHRRQTTIVSPLPFHCLEQLNWNSKITLVDSNHFVVNCSNYGFYMFDINRQTGTINCNPRKFLPAEEINCIFSDKEKRLWIGTPKGLLRQKLKESFLSLYTIAPTSKKMQYAESLTCTYLYKNKLYAGHYSRNTGLTILDATTMKTERHVCFYGRENGWNEVQSVQMYYADTLWLGTNAGILWFDTKSEHYGNAMKQIRNNQPGIINKILSKPGVSMNINLAPVGKDGYAWLVYGLRGIIARYDTRLRQIIFFTADTKPALPFNRVKTIVYDSYGDTWLSGHSLARWNSRRQTFDTLINVYAGARKYNENIIAIAADDSGSLWIHNEENGLLQYQINEKRFTAYSTDDGLPSNVFESFSPIVNNKLWMAGSTNLTCFDIRTKKTIVYNYDDGLSANLPTGRKIYYDMDRQSFYLCCENDLLVFSSRRTEYNYASGGILIEQLVFNDGRLIPQPQDRIRINPDSNSFSIHFSIVDYEAGSSYQFDYRLGAEKAWTDAGQQRIVNLNGLQPGKYRLAIRATAKAGQQKIKEFYFIIEPHYWQTIWFALLISLLVLIGLYFFLRARIKQVKQKANIDKQLAQMEIKALHAQMNPHFIFNSLNSIKEMVMNNENNEASVYLTKFAQMIRITLDQSAHTFVTLRSTADYLRRYIEMEKIRNNHFHCSLVVDDTLDQDETELPPMLIQPFIENAIWHGAVPPHKIIHINVSFRRAEEQLICIVEDNGIGIDKSVASKEGRTTATRCYGIANVQDRVRLLNEKYKLSSKVTIADKSRMSELVTGTIVTLELPLHILHP